MKLGRDTASLVNWMSQGSTPNVEVGMGATILMWTDREPATVRWISKSGRTLRFTEDVATLGDGDATIKTDSMGRGLIVYWPTIYVEDPSALRADDDDEN